MSCLVLMDGLLQGGHGVAQSCTSSAAAHSLQGPSAIQAAPAPHEEVISQSPSSESHAVVVVASLLCCTASMI